jgi:hypothetical protein
MENPQRSKVTVKHMRAGKIQQYRENKKDEVSKRWLRKGEFDFEAITIDD